MIRFVLSISKTFIAGLHNSCNSAVKVFFAAGHTDKGRKKMVYVFLVLGFVLLIKGADFFVDGSSSAAKLLKIPTIIIGLTVVAFGTSMPEASVSVTAALKGQNGLAVSNVLGSNIFNLLIVLGFSSVIRPLKASPTVLKKEFPFSILITAVLALSLFHNNLL